MSANSIGAFAASSFPMLAWMRFAISLAAILARASSVSTAFVMLSMVRRPLMTPPKSAGTVGMKSFGMAAFSSRMCFANAETPLATISPLMDSLRAFTSLSRSRRTRRASALISSMVRNKASMLAVWLRAWSFAALMRSSMSLHHFTAFSASAKCTSVVSSRLTDRMAPRAVSRNSERFDADTSPLSTMCRAGRASGAFPVGLTSAAVGVNSIRSLANCCQPAISAARRSGLLVYQHCAHLSGVPLLVTNRMRRPPDTSNCCSSCQT